MSIWNDLAVCFFGCKSTYKPEPVIKLINNHAKAHQNEKEYLYKEDAEVFFKLLLEKLTRLNNNNSNEINDFIAEVSNNYKKLQKENQALRNKQNTTAASISSLEQEIRTMHREINSLKSKHNDVLARLSLYENNTSLSLLDKID